MLRVSEAALASPWQRESILRWEHTAPAAAPPPPRPSNPGLSESRGTREEDWGPGWGAQRYSEGQRSVDSKPGKETYRDRDREAKRYGCGGWAWGETQRQDVKRQRQTGQREEGTQKTETQRTGQRVGSGEVDRDSGTQRSDEICRDTGSEDCDPGQIPLEMRGACRRVGGGVQEEGWAGRCRDTQSQRGTEHRKTWGWGGGAGTKAG